MRFRSHAEPHGNLTGWLWLYKNATPGTELGIEPTVRLDLDNEPQPDAVLLIQEQYGGRSRLSEDDYVEGAPELVAEIAASSAAFAPACAESTLDLGDKKRAYRRNGIPEYIVWQVFEQKLDWFGWQDGEYVPLPVDADGVVRSRVFPGLWLAIDSMLTGDMARVLAVLQAGLAMPEHAAFAEQLARQFDRPST